MLWGKVMMDEAKRTLEALEWQRDLFDPTNRTVYNRVDSAQR
jgi:hypothetical protein